MTVHHLIQLDDLDDPPAPDGTTAMAMALGRRNPEIVQWLLMRFLGGDSDHNFRFLAEEYLKDTRDMEYKDDLKVMAVRNAIMDVMEFNEDHECEQEQTEKDAM